MDKLRVNSHNLDLTLCVLLNKVDIAQLDMSFLLVNNNWCRNGENTATHFRDHEVAYFQCLNNI
jgi:hypothetical protein